MTALLPQVSVFSEPNLPLSEATQTPGAFVFRISEPAPLEGLVVEFIAGDDDPVPGDRDVDISLENSSNIEDFSVNPAPGFISFVTIAAGATEARLVVIPIQDLVPETDETISVDLLPSEYYFVDRNDSFAALTITDNTGVGSSRAEVLLGTPNPDLLLGRDGNDLLLGLPGDDTLLGETGNDLAIAGDDDDLVLGNTGNDFLQGLGGEDTVAGGLGLDIALGGEGRDLFVLAPGNGTDILLDFEVGTDEIALADGLTFEQVSIDPLSQSTILRVAATGEQLAFLPFTLAASLSEADFVPAPELPIFVSDSGELVPEVGESTNDLLVGTPAPDVLNGGPGSDTLLGEAGPDLLDGGSGSDRVEGGPGDDALLGDNRRDTLLGGAGDDLLSGETGSDRLFGGLGDDFLNGDRGQDSVFGGLGNDILNGGSGGDRLDGGSGADVINGDAGRDTILGGEGGDIIDGGFGDDSIDGGAGGDILNGGRGRDRFVLSFEPDSDLILDFEVGRDLLELPVGVAFEDVTLIQAGEDALVFLPDAPQPAAILAGVQASAIAETSFVEFAPLVNGLVVFGDSNSDTGNVFNALNQIFPPSPPNFNGRFSNGPNWVDQIAPALGLEKSEVSNFAFGGAFSGRQNQGDFTGAPGLPGILEEIDTFAAQVGPNGADPDVLYSVWFNGIDFQFVDPNDPLEVLEAIGSAVDNIIEGLTELAELGAEHILVPNLFNIGLIPEARELGLEAEGTFISRSFNRGLAASLLEWEAETGLDAIEVDLFGFSRTLERNPESLSFTNVTDPLLFNPDLESPESAYFWDELHLTTQGHAVITEIFLGAIESHFEVDDPLAASSQLTPEISSAAFAAEQSLVPGLA
ncbi:MAG: SGNH/GDSL hydrolase family protein [Cyanobacteria bacterium J06642_2]